MPVPFIDRQWRLGHRWQLASDLSALAVCADALADIGVALESSSGEADADAVKMHAFELVEARERLPLADLSSVALHDRWADRVHPVAWRVMRSGAEVHGIPMTIHRANVGWASRAAVDALGPLGAGGIDVLEDWLRAAAERVARPLLVGSRPWEIGVLFEAVALRELGASAWRAAFEDLDPEALTQPAMIELLRRFGSLRQWVDDDRLGDSWDLQFRGLSRGDGALMFMGDWAGATLAEGVVRLAGTTPESLVVDFLVPLRRADAALSRQIAARLTTDDCLARFSSEKGGSPPLLSEDWRTRRPPPFVPSLVFEQCCDVRRTSTFLRVIADHFLHRRPATSTARQLADIAAG